MELYTQNLLEVTLQESKIQSNFIVINDALKFIKQQLVQTFLNQDTIFKSMAKNKQSIDAIQDTLKQHTNIINNHSIWMGQLNFQTEDQPESPLRSSIIKQEQVIQNIISQDPENSKPSSKRRESVFKTNKSEINQQEGGPIAMIQNQNESKPVGKNKKSGLQKTLGNLKQRLTNLELESLQNRATIDEMNIILRKHRALESAYNNRKNSKQISKRSSQSNTPNETYDHLSPQLHQEQIKDPEQKCNQPRKSEIFDIFAKSTLQIATGAERFENINKELKQIKETLSDKIRVIDAQYKENQHRMQGLEKSVDILERSHEMLKYDFDRTSTSWGSRQRGNQTQDRSRVDNKLSDTRLAKKDYFQQKISELFQEMDKLKKQYIQFVNRLQDSQVGDQTTIIHQANNDPKQKRYSNYKLIHSLRTEGHDNNSKELSNVRREITKLRQQFEQFAWGMNTGNGDVKTVVIKPNQTKQDWKILSTKIYKLKMELQAGVRDLQGKIVTNNDMVVVLNQLEVGIEECRLLIKRKVEQSEYQKGLKRLQGRLNNFILQVYQKQGRQLQVQPSLAKQPWFCLSCDTQLKNYTGKVIKSPTFEKMPGRKVNPQSHMIRRNENGRLPSVLK